VPAQTTRVVFTWIAPRRGMEKKRSRYQTIGWRLARERIGQLVRENYSANQELSPRLKAFIKNLENERLELSPEALQTLAKKDD
jgi:hypothetical protein